MNCRLAKLKHWRGPQAENAPGSAPMLDFTSRKLLKTSEFRRSSGGWNPVHRLIKYLDGLGPSLRWDDGVFRSSLHSNVPTTTVYLPNGSCKSGAIRLCSGLGSSLRRDGGKFVLGKCAEKSVAACCRERHSVCCRFSPIGRPAMKRPTRNTLRSLRATTLATNRSAIEVGPQIRRETTRTKLPCRCDDDRHIKVVGLIQS